MGSPGRASAEARGSRSCWTPLKEERPLDWTERILQFPVRAAAVDDFLRDLRARGAGDLNGVMSTLNDGSLCRQAQEYWVRQGWVVVSPSTPLHALAGPRFSRELSLGHFCGMPEEPEIPAEAEGSERDDDS